MDTRNQITDFNEEVGGGDGKRLTKEHICIIHGHDDSVEKA